MEFKINEVFIQIESSFYKSTCNACRKSVRAFFTIDGEFRMPALSSTITPNTRDIRSTTALTMPNKCIFHPIHSSQGLSTF